MHKVGCRTTEDEGKCRKIRYATGITTMNNKFHEPTAVDVWRLRVLLYSLRAYRLTLTFGFLIKRLTSS